MTAFWLHAVNRNQDYLKRILVSVFLSFWLVLSMTPSLQASVGRNTHLTDPDFPHYPSINPNVEFWISIFTKFSKRQGVLHDSRNLGVVYDIVTLDTSETARGNRKNKRKKKAAANKYKKILINLSRNNTPHSQEEKRIAALFGPGATPSDFKTAVHGIRCQAGLKKQFKDGLIRSGAVIDEFKRIFRSHGLPVDLIYLPCVESSYNFKAYSKFGAAGIWQFTRSTGRQFMKIGYVVDERRDPYISTDAAARLLKKNYAELKEWPLAITAYNHGRAGMMRAKNSFGSYEKIIQSYRSRSFKFASRNFYSEFLAARIVAKNPEKYFKDIRLKKPVTFQSVKIKKYLPIKALSQQLDLSIKDIKTLNPSLRKPVFNGQKYIPKGFVLRLPKNLNIPNINRQLAVLYQDKQNQAGFTGFKKGIQQVPLPGFILSDCRI